METYLVYLVKDILENIVDSSIAEAVAKEEKEEEFLKKFRDDIENDSISARDINKVKPKFSEKWLKKLNDKSDKKAKFSTESINKKKKGRGKGGK